MLFSRRLPAGAFASALLALAMSAAPASSQTLRDFVEAAASRNPELLGLNGRRDAINARQFAADAITPGLRPLPVAI